MSRFRRSNHSNSRVCCPERCQERGERHYKPSDVVRIGVQYGYEVGINEGLPGQYAYALRLKTADRNEPPRILEGAHAAIDFIYGI